MTTSVTSLGVNDRPGAIRQLRDEAAMPWVVTTDMVPVQLLFLAPKIFASLRELSDVRIDRGDDWTLGQHSGMLATQSPYTTPGSSLVVRFANANCDRFQNGCDACSGGAFALLGAAVETGTVAPNDYRLSATKVLGFSLFIGGPVVGNTVGAIACVHIGHGGVSTGIWMPPSTDLDVFALAQGCQSSAAWQPCPALEKRLPVLIEHSDELLRHIAGTTQPAAS